MKKNVIRCPACEAKGIKQNLGLVLGAGTVSVRRWFDISTNRNEFSIITGDAFDIRCGLCGEVAYKRERRPDVQGTVLNFREEWVHWEGTIPAFIGTRA
jgi:hypothetical protein